MLETIPQADHVGQVPASLFFLAAKISLVVEWDLDVLDHVELLDQVVRLENKADPLCPDIGKLVVVQDRHGAFTQDECPGGGAIEAAKQVASIQGVAHAIMEIDLGSFGGSALTGDMEVPKGRGMEEISSTQSGIPVTYVPARNTIFQ